MRHEFGEPLLISLAFIENSVFFVVSIVDIFYCYGCDVAFTLLIKGFLACARCQKGTAVRCQGIIGYILPRVTFFAAVLSR